MSVIDGAALLTHRSDEGETDEEMPALGTSPSYRPSEDSIDYTDDWTNGHPEVLDACMQTLVRIARGNNDTGRPLFLHYRCCLFRRNFCWKCRTPAGWLRVAILPRSIGASCVVRLVSRPILHHRTLRDAATFRRLTAVALLMAGIFSHNGGGPNRSQPNQAKRCALPPPK